MARRNYKLLWDELIGSLMSEIYKIEKLPERAKTPEDVWVKGTLCNVLRKMCALNKLPPKMQKEELTKPLFED